MIRVGLAALTCLALLVGVSACGDVDTPGAVSETTAVAIATATTVATADAEKSFLVELGPDIQRFYVVIADESRGPDDCYSEVHSLLATWQDRVAPSDRTGDLLGRWLSMVMQWDSYFGRLKAGEPQMAQFILNSFDTEQASVALAKAAAALTLELGLPIETFVSPSTTTTTMRPATTTEPPMTTTTEPPTTTTSTPPQWVTVAEFSGSSRKITDSFALSGAKARLVYSAGQGRTYLSAFLVPEGQREDEPGSELVIEVSDPTSDSTMVNQRAGRYYFFVIAYDCKWTLTVQELR